MAADLIRRGFLSLLTAALVAACAATAASAPAAKSSAEPVAVTRFFLVRHGEKEAGSDPALTPAGAERARALAERLKAEGVTEIWSTRTRRTQQAAAPMAAQTGLVVQTYDATTLPAFASWLLDVPGVKLVVGHSNTTGELAALLGADPGPPIDDAREFDRLYVISVDADGIVRSRIERYGARSPLASK